jgi:hypothetical protein
MKKVNKTNSIEKFAVLSLSKKQLSNVRGGEDSSGNENPPVFPQAPPDPRKR